MHLGGGGSAPYADPLHADLPPQADPLPPKTDPLQMETSPSKGRPSPSKGRPPPSKGRPICGQTDAYENITFPASLRYAAVKNSMWSSDFCLQYFQYVFSSQNYICWRVQYQNLNYFENNKTVPYLLVMDIGLFLIYIISGIMTTTSADEHTINWQKAY